MGAIITNVSLLATLILLYTKTHLIKAPYYSIETKTKDNISNSIMFFSALKYQLFLKNALDRISIWIIIIY